MSAADELHAEIVAAQRQREEENPYWRESIPDATPVWLCCLKLNEAKPLLAVMSTHEGQRTVVVPSGKIRIALRVCVECAAAQLTPEQYCRLIALEGDVKAVTRADIEGTHEDPRSDSDPAPQS